MKKILKYGLFPVLTFVFLFVTTVLLLPVLINVQKYTPVIEEKLSLMSGRSVTLGHDLGVSFFPWLGVSVSDVILGNPKGFRSDYLVKFESFEARIKLLPLLKGEIQISRFVISGLDLNLEKGDDGRDNWDIARSIFPKGRDGKSSRFTLVQDISVGLFAVTDGAVQLTDGAGNVLHSLDNLMVLLHDLNLRKNVILEGEGVIDGNMFAVEGKIGSIEDIAGKLPGVRVDLVFDLLEDVEMEVEGVIRHVLDDPQFDLEVTMPSFSLRSMDDFLFNVPPKSSPILANITDIRLEARVQGTVVKGVVDKGKVSFNDTNVGFDFAYDSKETSPLYLFCDVDSIDLDRYFPANVEPRVDLEEKASSISKNGQTATESKDPTFVSALHIGEVSIGGLHFQNIETQAQYVNGMYSFDYMTFDGYGGLVESELTIDASQEGGATYISLQVGKIRAKPLLQDILGVKGISGDGTADFELEFTGTDRNEMLQSLNGKGHFRLLNGEIAGKDVMRVLNTTSVTPPISDGKDPQLVAKFSDITGDFSIQSGVIDSRDVQLITATGRRQMSGTVDLNSSDFALQILPDDNINSDEESVDNISTLPFTIRGNTRDSGKLQIESYELIADTLSLPDDLYVQSLVDEKIPSPVDDDVKDLVGQALVDPAIVARRFRLQPEQIGKKNMKIVLPLGSGKIHINSLVEETDF